MTLAGYTIPAGRKQRGEGDGYRAGQRRDEIGPRHDERRYQTVRCPDDDASA